ncbi:MAG: hypothetical protein QW506_06480 [Thermoproteota archaeon]
MSAQPPSDEQVIAEFADTLAKELKRLLYPREYFESMRRLKTPTEKLVYLYVWLTQPQTFNGIKRGLNLSSTSIHKAVKSLTNSGLVLRDEWLLYWIKTEGETTLSE